MQKAEEKKILDVWNTKEKERRNLFLSRTSAIPASLPFLGIYFKTKPDFVSQTDLVSHFYCSWPFDSLAPGTDTVGCSFHQSAAVVALETSRMMLSSFPRHTVAGPWVSLPSNLKTRIKPRFIYDFWSIIRVGLVPLDALTLSLFTPTPLPLPTALSL